MFKHPKTNENVVAFYTTKEEFGCFSNFYRCKIKLDDVEWPTSEHYYQAQKTIKAEDYCNIMNAPNPKEAARIGRSIEICPNWEKKKLDVMRKVVRAKFLQHPELEEKLLSTGNREIVEWTEGTPLADSVWGNARKKDGSPGQNLLGKVLMETREYFVNMRRMQDAYSGKLEI